MPTNRKRLKCTQRRWRLFGRPFGYEKKSSREKDDEQKKNERATKEQIEEEAVSRQEEESEDRDFSERTASVYSSSSSSRRLFLFKKGATSSPKTTKEDDKATSAVDPVSGDGHDRAIVVAVAAKGKLNGWMRNEEVICCRGVGGGGDYDHRDIYFSGKEDCSTTRSALSDMSVDGEDYGKKDETLVVCNDQREETAMLSLLDTSLLVETEHASFLLASSLSTSSSSLRKDRGQVSGCASSSVDSIASSLLSAIGGGWPVGKVVSRIDVDDGGCIDVDGEDCIDVDNEDDDDIEETALDDEARRIGLSWGDDWASAGSLPSSIVGTRGCNINNGLIRSTVNKSMFLAYTPLVDTSSQSTGTCGTGPDRCGKVEISSPLRGASVDDHYTMTMSKTMESETVGLVPPKRIPYDVLKRGGGGSDVRPILKVFDDDRLCASRRSATAAEATNRSVCVGGIVGGGARKLGGDPSLLSLPLPLPSSSKLERRRRGPCARSA